MKSEHTYSGKMTQLRNYKRKNVLALTEINSHGSYRLVKISLKNEGHK